MIFFFFQPREHIEKEAIEIPSLELNNFKLSELDRSGLTSITSGDVGKKYTNRYSVKNLNYTDNSSKYISNIKANDALYKGFILNLRGDIKYFREDGLTFRTQKASYNKQTSVITSHTKYQSQLNESSAEGSYFEYNNAHGITKSKNVTVNYNLKERI